MIVIRTFSAFKNRRDHGFALIVALTLMVLLTAVAVGLLSLSAITLRTGTEGAAIAEARANARLAIMLALGEMQKELGPDQRISAPGSQQLEENDPSAGGQWVGVYDAWPAGTEIRPTPKFRRWLISGDESIVTAATAPQSPLPSIEKIPLVAAIAGQDAVEAALIKTKSGGYAWWVGDQSMKAKLGGAVSAADHPIIATNRMQSSPRASHEVFFNGETVAPDAPELDHLVSERTIELLGASDRPLFHDATSISLGLLTNVRTGGFRKDLNFLMETPLPTADTPAVAPLYTAGSAAGINLGELWVDHNIWAEIEYPTSPPRHADGGTIPSGMPFLITNEKEDPFLLYRHLPRLQLTLLYSLISKSRTVNGRTVYDLFLVADPVFTIWNPFDVCLHVPASAFATFKSWAIPYDLNLTFEDGPSGSRTSFSRSIKELSNDRLFFFYGQLGRSQNLVLRPGEVQVIAQGFGDTIRNPVQGVWQFDGKLGWEFASGYAYPIPYETDPRMMRGTQRITYSMTPNNIKSDAGLFLWSYNIGELVDSSNITKYVGSFNIDLVYSRLSGENAISADQFPEIFPPLPRDPSAANTIAQLENNKWPICVFTYGLRTESDPMFEGNQNAGTRFTGRAMLRANETSVSQDLYNLAPDIVRTSPLQVGMRRVNSLNSPIIECDANGLGYFGAEYGASGGVSHVITRSIPRSPIHSLGALQHGAAEGARFGQARGERSWFMQPSISHAISNSFAPSFLAPAAVRGTLANRPAADHSYLANLALWDHYFYSSITPRTTSAYRDERIAYREQRSRLEAFLATDTNRRQLLPNERMRAWTNDPEAAVRNIFPSVRPAPDAADRTASFLMVDGMFNVNSTSVNAWRGFLSGLKSAKVPVSPTPGLRRESILLDATNTPVAALLTPGAGEIDDASLNDPAENNQWLGFRNLNDTQIEELAIAIVKQVRLRGPFLSIADFVNRRPGNDKDLALSGPLQSALDDNTVSINQAYRQGGRSLGIAEAAAQGFPFPEAEAGAKSVSAPGYVKQADLLTSLGPMIHVRGDTFVIRGYGEARDPSGQSVLARAWCEAIIQRVPDYIDPADQAYQPVPTSTQNLAFGRRFDIVSFRYLHPREII